MSLVISSSTKPPAYVLTIVNFFFVDVFEKIPFFFCSVLLQFFIGRGLQNISEAINKNVNNCTDFDGFKY
jgi:hypothetical protein